MDKHDSENGACLGRHLIYNPLISNPGASDLLIEIGIATNDRQTPDSTGLQETPWASMRALLAWGVGAFGC